MGLGSSPHTMPCPRGDTSDSGTLSSPWGPPWHPSQRSPKQGLHARCRLDPAGPMAPPAKAEGREFPVLQRQAGCPARAVLPAQPMPGHRQQLHTSPGQGTRRSRLAVEKTTLEGSAVAQSLAQRPPSKALCPSVTSVASVCPAQPAAVSSPTHSVSTVTVRVTTGSPPFSPAGYSVTSTISVTMVSVTSVTSVTSRVVTGFQDQVLRGTLARGGVQAAPPACPLTGTPAAPPFCTATSDWLRLSTGLPGRLRMAPGTGLQPFSTGTGAFSSSPGQASATPPADGCPASSPGSRRSSSGRRLFSPRQLGRLTEFPMAWAPGPRLKSRPARSQGMCVTGATAGPPNAAGLRSGHPPRSTVLPDLTLRSLGSCPPQRVPRARVLGQGDGTRAVTGAWRREGTSRDPR